MSAEFDEPPGVVHASENHLLAKRYAEILVRMCSADFRTDDFKGSGLVGQRLLGFYVLRLDSGNISIGISHCDPGEKNKDNVRTQELDIHDGWRPFTEDVLKDMTEWSEMPPERQQDIRLLAQRRGYAPPKKPLGSDGLADVIAVNWKTKKWINIGPYGRPIYDLPNSY